VRILLVEDEIKVGNALSKGSQAERYEITWAQTAGHPPRARLERMRSNTGSSNWVVVCLAICLLLVPTVACSQSKPGKVGSPAVLVKVADIPMPGPAVRFDYQSLDAESGRLYISHMNADQLVVFDTAKRQVVANLDGFRRVHGVWAVPELARVYASVTGEHAVAVIDSKTLHTLAKVGPITYPDGLAYAPTAKRVFVSDEHGNTDAVIDATNNALVTSIPLGGGAGNTVYDPNSGHILVAVHGLNQLVAIDPASAKIVGRYSLPGVSNPHGIALDTANHLAFVAGEENHSLAVFDLNTMKMVSIHEVGDDPDVLAFDPGLKRLYVSAESGTVFVFEENGRELRVMGQLHIPHAHTVSIDPITHLVYFPLEDIDGHPLLRIMRPVAQN
jgi:DNA-binding beta-propeller fold protein YncE